MICWSKFDFFVDSWIMFRGIEQMLQFSFLHFAETTWLQVEIGIFCSILLHSAHCLLRKANNGSFHSPGLKRESFL